MHTADALLPIRCKLGCIDEEVPNLAVGFEAFCPFKNHFHSDVCHPTERVLSMDLKQYQETLTFQRDPGDSKP